MPKVEIAILKNIEFENQDLYLFVAFFAVFGLSAFGRKELNWWSSNSKNVFKQEVSNKIQTLMNQ